MVNEIQRLSDVRKVIQKPLGDSNDWKTGILYIAEAEVDKQKAVKIGFSENDAEKRIEAIQAACGRIIRRKYETPRVRGAYRAESIIHKYLADKLYLWYCHKCGIQHREWFLADYETAVGQMINIIYWMKRQPYDFKAAQLSSEWATPLQIFKAKITTSNPMTLWQFFALRTETLSQSTLSIDGVLEMEAASSVDSAQDQGESGNEGTNSDASNKDAESRASRSNDGDSDGEIHDCNESDEEELHAEGSNDNSVDGEINEYNEIYDSDDSRTRIENGLEEEDSELSESQQVNEDNECTDDGAEVDSQTSSINDDENLSIYFDRLNIEDQYDSEAEDRADLDAEVEQLEEEPNSTGDADDELESLRLLLNPSTNFTNNEMALNTVCRQGATASVIRLLCTDVDVNACGGFDGSALHAACRMGHIETVAILLQNNADVNQYGGVYGYALQAAAAGGYLPIVAMLLEHEADVDASGGLFGTATHAAAYYGHIAVVRVLLDKGENSTALAASKQAGDENTINTLLQAGMDINLTLYDASKNGCERVVELLLQCGADANTTNTSGLSALYAACSEGHDEVVQMLLKKGADPHPEQATFSCELPLTVAARRSHLNIVKILLIHGAQDRLMYTTNSALYEATKGGHIEIVKVLLERNIKVNPYGKVTANQPDPARGIQTAQAGKFPRLSPLYYISETAIADGHAEILELLLQHGVDVNGDSLSPLLITASCGSNVEIVKTLLRYGADVNYAGGFGLNALLTAAIGCHAEIVRLLLQAGANESAIYEAVSRGHEKAVLCLLEAGVDPDIRGGDGQTPLLMAVKNNHGSIVEILTKYKANVNAGCEKHDNPLYIAASNGNRGIVNTMIKGGANSNAMCLAARLGNAKMIQLLIEEGAKVNDGLLGSGNALYSASLRGHKEVVAMLLAEGAPVQTWSGWFGNPLQAGVVSGNYQVVQLLLDNGARVTQYGGHYDTALQAACAENNEEIVKLLLQRGPNTLEFKNQMSKPLCAASDSGNHTIVELLLKAGAAVNSQELKFGNALHAACASGHMQVVQLLLEHGAPVHTAGEFYCDAFEAASDGGHEAIIEVLTSFSRKAQLLK